MLYKATKDTAYLYHVNEETCSDAKITGIYYLQKKGNAGETNNYIYITASATISDSEDSKTVYFAFSYSNAYINADGTFDMNHDNEERGMSAVQITIHFTVNVLAVKVTTIL